MFGPKVASAIIFFVNKMWGSYESGGAESDVGVTDLRTLLRHSNAGELERDLGQGGAANLRALLNGERVVGADANDENNTLTTGTGYAESGGIDMQDGVYGSYDRAVALAVRSSPLGDSVQAPVGGVFGCE